MTLLQLEAVIGVGHTWLESPFSGLRSSTPLESTISQCRAVSCVEKGIDRIDGTVAPSKSDGWDILDSNSTACTITHDSSWPGTRFHVCARLTSK